MLGVAMFSSIWRAAWRPWLRANRSACHLSTWLAFRSCPRRHDRRRRGSRGAHLVSQAGQL